MTRGRLTVNDTVLMLGRLVLWAVAFVVAYQGQMVLEDRGSLGRALVYMVVATVFIVAATLGWHPRRREAASEGPGAGRARAYPRVLWQGVASFWLLAVALGLGLSFRLYLLTKEPFGIWFDEAQNGLIARDILHGHFPPVFIGGFSFLPSLYFYVLAGASKLMGEGIVTVRTVSTVGGLLALPMVFLLARELFGTRVGVLATFFLAVMRWHVNFSRFGVSNIWASFLALAAVYFLVRGLRGRGRWNLVASGIFTGLGPYTGFYFTFIPGVMVLYWLHSALSQRVLRLRDHALAIVVVGVVAAAVYSPVGVWGLRHQDEFTLRPNTVSIVKGKSRGDAVQAVLKGTKQHVLMFNSWGDTNGRHNLPGSPMLDTFTGIFFVLGIGICAAKARRPEYFLLLAWLPLVLQGGIWSDGAPQAFRTSAVTPAVAMLAALPLGAALSFAYDRRRAPDLWEGGKGSFWQEVGGIVRGDPVGYAARLLVGLAALFFLAQAGRLNFDTYFHKQLKRPDVWSSYSAAPTIVGHEINRLRTEGAQFYVSTTFVNEPSRLFLTGPDTGDIAAFDTGSQIPVRVLQPAVFFHDALEEAQFRRLQTMYPGGTFIEHRGPGGGGPVVLESVLDSDDIRSLMGVAAVYSGSGGQSVQRMESEVSADWSTTAPFEPPFRASWSGFIAMPDYGEYVLGLRVPGHGRVLLDGELFAEGDSTLEGHALLFQGPHRMEIEADIQGKGMVQLYWVRPKAKTTEPVPSTDLFSSPSVYWGLRASFYAGVGFEKTPVWERLDPFVAFRYGGDANIPVSGPFSAHWKGKLLVPASGTYGMRLFTIGDGRVLIDGQQVLVSAPSVTSELEVALTAGPRDIEVFFSNSTGSAQVMLSWRPPGGEWTTIPAQYFALR